MLIISRTRRNFLGGITDPSPHMMIAFRSLNPVGITSPYAIPHGPLIKAIHGMDISYNCFSLVENILSSGKVLSRLAGGKKNLPIKQRKSTTYLRICICGERERGLSKRMDQAKRDLMAIPSLLANILSSLLAKRIEYLKRKTNRTNHFLFPPLAAENRQIVPKLGQTPQNASVLQVIYNDK